MSRWYQQFFRCISSRDVRKYSIAPVQRVTTLILLGIARVGICSGDEGNENPPVVFTTKQDHENMLGQLGIRKLRPGPSGDPKGTNPANYDESKANPTPELPDLLRTKDGKVVDSAEMWNTVRRQEILEDFQQHVVGKVPTDVPSVQWDVIEERERSIDGVDVSEKKIVGTVDNHLAPEIEVKISMSLALPKNATKPVPVLIMFGPTPFDPLPPWMTRNRTGGPAQTTPQISREGELLKAGWGVVFLNPSSIQDDAGGVQTRFPGSGSTAETAAKGGGLTRGIIGLTNRGQPRKPIDWGALRAWAWGASRSLDYLESVKEVDSKKVGIEGVSRYGKAALVTLAFDTRFAMGLIGSAGEGGVSPYRRNFGEAVENLTGSGEYHWMAGNFLKYGAAESDFGSLSAKDLPVDAHSLIALCAPRLTFVSYGIPEKGDALWLDQTGSYMAVIAAQKVFRLLGASDLGKGDDYMHEVMPNVNQGLLDGDLAWRQHDGGHTDAPNISYFIQWANKRFESKSTD